MSCLRWGGENVDMILDVKPQCVRPPNQLKATIFCLFVLSFFIHSCNNLFYSPYKSSSFFSLFPTTQPLPFLVAYCTVCLRAHLFSYVLSAVLLLELEFFPALCLVSQSFSFLFCLSLKLSFSFSSSYLYFCIFTSFFLSLLKLLHPNKHFDVKQM